MFQKLPMYQNVGVSAYKKDITNIINICNHLDNPQNKFRISIKSTLFGNYNAMFLKRKVLWQFLII